MKAIAIVSMAVLGFGLTVNCKAQAASTGKGVPETLHLCTDHCETLVWSVDHYDGTDDNSGSLLWRYTVTSWSKGRVEFSGTRVDYTGSSPKVRADFKGTIGPDGGSLVNAKMSAYVNAMPMIQGAAFKLTWDAKGETGQGASEEQAQAAPAPAPPDPAAPAAEVPISQAPLKPTAITSDAGRDLAAEQAMIDKNYAQLLHLKALHTQQSPPSPLYECEEVDSIRHCAIWNFANHQYTGRWLDEGSQGQMIVITLSDTSVHIEREDFAGATKGLTAKYSGTWNGSEIIGGRVISFYKGWRDGTWTATTTPPASPWPTSTATTAPVSDAKPVTLSWTEVSKLLIPVPVPVPTDIVPYPMIGKMMHSSGDLWLTFVISRQGKVRDVEESAKGNSLFLGSTKEYMENTWSFHPYLRDGLPTAVRTSIHVKFDLNKGVEVLDK